MIVSSNRNDRVYTCDTLARDVAAQEIQVSSTCGEWEEDEGVLKHTRMRCKGVRTRKSRVTFRR